MRLNHRLLSCLLFISVLIVLVACTDDADNKASSAETTSPTQVTLSPTITATLTSTATSTVTPTQTPTQTKIPAQNTGGAVNEQSSIANTVNTSSKQTNKPVTIQTFSTTVATVSASDLQAGTARVPVSWQVINRPTGSNLSFVQLQSDGRAVNIELPRDNPYVNSSGSGIVAPVLSGNNATHITLVLNVYEASTGTTYTNSTIRIPITYPQDNADVVINQFSTTATEVFEVQLEQETARIPVTWSVSNRPANSNLVFEQLLSDGTLQNIELPRHVRQVSSSGNGAVAPVASGNDVSEITIVLRVIDLSTNKTYAQSQFKVSVNDDADEGVTIFDDCYSDQFLPSNNLTIGENAIVKFYPDSGGFHFVYTSRSGTGRVGGLQSGPLKILDGPFCFQRPERDYPQRRWLIRYEDGVQGWIDEYVIWSNDSYWAFIADSYDAGASVNTFSIDRTVINQGEVVTVTWDVKNTDRVAIRLLNSLGENFITENGDNLPASGSVEIASDMIATLNSVELYYPPNLTDMLVFKATCTHKIIDPSVTQYPTCPHAPQTKNAVYQQFQFGYMVWHDGGIIATFTNDGANSGTFLNTYQEGDVLNFPNKPSDELITPERGFGKVWLNNVYLQNQLGWAISSEQSYTMTLQAVPQSITYITLPNGSYETYSTYGLYDD